MLLAAFVAVGYVALLAMRGFVSIVNVESAAELAQPRKIFKRGRARRYQILFVVHIAALIVLEAQFYGWPELPLMFLLVWYVFLLALAESSIGYPAPRHQPLNAAFEISLLIIEALTLALAFALAT